MQCDVGDNVSAFPEECVLITIHKNNIKELTDITYRSLHR